MKYLLQNHLAKYHCLPTLAREDRSLFAEKATGETL